MNTCKFCSAELEENSTVCPMCGKDNAAPVEEKPEVTAPAEETVEAAPTESPVPAEEAAPVEEASKKSNTMKIALSVAALVVVVAVLIAAIVSGASKKDEEVPADIIEAEATEAAEPTTPPTVPADGNPDDETCKGTYTVEDAAVLAARDTVVARVGDKELTNAQLQVYYWMEVRNFLNNYGAYAAYFGLDYREPLDTQVCGVTENGETWQQYFLQAALNSWHHYQAMAAQAEELGIPVSEEHQAIIDTSVSDLDAVAAQGGFSSAADMLKESLGATVEIADYEDFMRIYYSGYSYYKTEMDTVNPTDEELEAFFEEHAEGYAESGVTKETCTVDVRHILVYPEGADSTNLNTQEFSEEAWAAGEAQAQAILDEWLAGEATEDSFAALANERSGDPGSNTNGGLYTDVKEGEMVQAFNDWCFDAERKPGDYGIVKTNYGYHVMYFVDSHLLWMEYVKNDMVSEKGNSLVDGATTKFPLTVDYSAILLGNVNMA